MSIDTTRAPSAQLADAPAIPFDPSNLAHQRAWQSVLNMGRIETERRTSEAAAANEPDARAVDNFAGALTLYIDARCAIVMEPPAETDEDEEEEDRLVDALTAAEEYVMAHGAPDWRSLLAKVEIATHDSRVLASDHLDGIKADIMRLASIDRSPTFLPLEWLNQFERDGGKTSLVQQEEAHVPVLSVPTNSARANQMLRDLEDHERAAIGEHLLRYLDPADYGLTVEARHG